MHLTGRINTQPKSMARRTRARAFRENRCRKESRPRQHARGRGKSLTASPTQIRTVWHHQQRKAFGSSSCIFMCRAAARLFGLSMHLSFYLVIAALVILGAEVAYALYQLVNLTL
jgi:hypothetical protein